MPDAWRKVMGILMELSGSALAVTFERVEACDCLRRRSAGASGLSGVMGACLAGWLAVSFYGLAGVSVRTTLPRSLLKFSGGHSSFRLLPDRTLRV